jgi:hypothetical protein
MPLHSYHDFIDETIQYKMIPMMSPFPLKHS